MIDSLCAGVPAISPHSGADAAGPGVGIHYTLYTRPSHFRGFQFFIRGQLPNWGI